jgi:transcriptional regulator with XRE-family HTH domain
MSFGERLRQERCRRHLSQKALAEVLGTSPKSISRWERDQTIPQTYYRVQLSHFLSLPPEYLFENSEIQIPLTERRLHTSSEAAHAASTQEIDPLQDFLAACCELHPRAWSRASDLWRAYEHWGKQQRERFPLSRREFTVRLKAQGCRADRTNSARIWRGITLVKCLMTTGDTT